MTADIQEALGTTAVLDEIFAAKSATGPLVCWDIGASNLHGLTPAGLSRALRATAEWIEGLDETGQTALARKAPKVTVGTQTWVIPVIPGYLAQVANMMQSVLREPGSLGRMP